MSEAQHFVLRLAGYRSSVALFALSLCAQHNVAARSMAAADYFASPQEIALAEASEKGDVKALERLRSAGADLNAAGRDGMTPAFWAIGRNRAAPQLHR
jgi:ankyrin repeat protein